VIERILVATDFSPSADTAWRWAVDVARRFGAELRLVHVAMPMSGEAAPNPPQDDDRDVALAQPQRLLEERAAAVPTSRVKTILRRGEPAHVLAALARYEYIDLLVVGTHEHHGAGDILIGSVAERLIRLAPCTVVVVKPSNDSVDPAH
jgi:universal stress protein A